jgi:hypothetical protein
MAEEKPSLESRLEQLTAQVQALAGRVEQLAAKLELEEPAIPVAATREHIPPPAESVPVEFTLGEAEDVSEEILSWAGRAHLLSRLSTLCFLLVVALVLRTVTDNNLINTLLGSILGMSYAAILMLAGWYRYEKKSPLAPVFVACGAVLMSTIVVETHSRFASLPLVPAYFTLMLTGMGMAFVSYRYKALLPISLGTLGMCLAGAAIDYPHPFFPFLAMVLLTANILGYFAAQLKRCSWLRWIILIVTMVMLHLWGFRLGMTLLRKETPLPELALQWFLPALALFALVYLVLAFLGIVRSGAERISRFDFTLPTLSSIWAFAVALYVVNAWGGSKYLLGGIGVAVALGHLGTTIWLAGRNVAGAPGTNSFAFAGTALLALALPVASGNFVLSLPVLAVVAFFMSILARKWQNGGVRATMYLVEIYACLALAVSLRGMSAAAVDFVNVIPAGLLAVISLFHYQWCRKVAPPAESAIFSRFDSHDRSAVALLVAALVNGFFMLRITIHHFLSLSSPGGDITNAFRCSQSVLINAAAAGIMVFAFFRRNKEIRNVAILVTVVGGIKVFLYDLFGSHGVPLVISVFTFGLAAAVESLALGRWQRHKAGAPEA